MDGHRAKTLSLLWCILLRFQVTALIDLPALKSEIYRFALEAADGDDNNLDDEDSSLLVRAADEVFGRCLPGGGGNQRSNFEAAYFSEMDRNQRALFLWAKVVCWRFDMKVGSVFLTAVFRAVICIHHIYVFELRLRIWTSRFPMDVSSATSSTPTCPPSSPGPWFESPPHRMQIDSRVSLMPNSCETIWPISDCFRVG